jgi:Family of unknown function (DUF5681)
MVAKTKSPSTPPRADDEPANRTVSGQFRKGFSGNPSGRPKSRPFRDALEAVLKAAGPEADLQAIATSLCATAIAGNVQGIREIADRLDGKVPQSIAGIDDDENLAPLVPILNVGRTQPRPASKASGPRSKARRLRSSTAARPAS